MPISPCKVNLNKVIKYTANMDNSIGYLPVILLEGTVVAGRTYQAYKRGGITEARERVLEESTGSVVWLGGAPLLLKIGNYIGNKFAGIKNTNFDIGRDTLRNPLEYVVKTTQNATKEKYTRFKFANTVLSVALTSLFLGFVVPKLNQRLTKFLYKKQETNPNKENALQEPNEKTLNNQDKLSKIVVSHFDSKQADKFNSMDAFLRNSQKATARNVAFKGIISPDTLAVMTHSLERNPLVKLGTTDTGLVIGRGINARNADETREIVFRDSTSSFFYLGAAPLVKGALTMLDGKILKGNSEINTYSASAIHNYLLDGMQNEKMSLQEFADYALGKFDKQQFEKLTFDKNGIISLDAFNEIIADKSLQAKAVKMATMQPLRNGNAVLTKMQAQDVLTNGKITEPEFLKSILNGILGRFGSNEDLLSDPTKFISRKDIEKYTKQIKAYTESILEYAKKRNITEITPELMLKVNKRNFYCRLGFVTAGFVVAATFLSTIIPKMQYWITKMKTGSNEFPGIKDIDKSV